MYSKELVRGTLSTIILRLLEENGKMYGYEIAQKVKEVSEEKILIKEGSLYPILHSMEADGFLTVEKVNIGKRVRKYYTITPEGKKSVSERVQELKSFMNTIERFLNQVPGMDLST